MQEKTSGNLFVIGQFALLGALLLLPSRTDWTLDVVAKSFAFAFMAIGLSIALASILKLGKSLSANPVPLETAELKTSGMYAVVRHPIYLGILMAAIGITSQTGSMWSLPIFVALATLLNFKARFEEKLLKGKFANYKEYASRVGRLIPGVGKLKN